LSNTQTIVTTTTGSQVGLSKIKQVQNELSSQLNDLKESMKLKDSEIERLNQEISNLQTLVQIESLKTDNKSSWGTGGPGYNINAEFSSRSHLRGMVSMARSQDPNSAGSQFFIVTSDSTFLDKQYTVFGEVTEGMDIADKIVNLKRDGNDCPLEKTQMIHVTVG